MGCRSAAGVLQCSLDTHLDAGAFFGRGQAGPCSLSVELFDPPVPHTYGDSVQRAWWFGSAGSGVV